MEIWLRWQVPALHLGIPYIAGAVRPLHVELPFAARRSAKIFHSPSFEAVPAIAVATRRWMVSRSRPGSHWSFACP